MYLKKEKKLGFDQLKNYIQAAEHQQPLAVTGIT